MRILLVEDEPTLRTQLGAVLDEHGYRVQTSADGREAAYLGREYPPALAIVDVGLPQLSGIEVVRQWRAATLHFPVLMLTARGHWQDKVEGLEAGADDYLVKPFHVEELLARVQALLRRAGGFTGTQLQYGPIRLDMAAKAAFLDGTPLELTAYEYQLLLHLMQHPGEVLSKLQLTDVLYEQDVDRDSNVIEVFIGRLRRKLDPQGQLRPIATVRGLGYRFDPPGSA